MSPEEIKICPQGTKERPEAETKMNAQANGIKMKSITFLASIAVSASSIYPCVSAGNKYVCAEYLSPVVTKYGYAPDSITFIGVASKQIRADYTIKSLALGEIISASIDSGSESIQDGLDIEFNRGAIVLSGKTAQAGTKTQYLKLLRGDRPPIRIKFKVAIKSNEECYEDDF